MQGMPCQPRPTLHWRQNRNPSKRPLANKYASDTLTLMVRGLFGGVEHQRRDEGGVFHPALVYRRVGSTADIDTQRAPCLLFSTAACPVLRIASPLFVVARFHMS